MCGVCAFSARARVCVRGYAYACVSVCVCVVFVSSVRERVCVCVGMCACVRARGCACAYVSHLSVCNVGSVSESVTARVSVRACG